MVQDIFGQAVGPLKGFLKWRLKLNLKIYNVTYSEVIQNNLPKGLG